MTTYTHTVRQSKLSEGDVALAGQDQHISTVVINTCGPDDVPDLLGLIDALADFEHLARPSEDARQRLAADALANPPRYNALIARADGRAVGYAILFETYSTFLARPTLYLEDIFVLETARRLGVGRTLMRAIAREAMARGCGRIEWQVLDWNVNAQRFYDGLGARRMSEWWPYRVVAEDIQRLATE
jgi:GNAT superfamily N-acetyltransferase